MVYIYFNYQSRDTQTPVQITRSIIKRLISGLAIPEELTSIYEKFIQEAKDPGMNELIQILELCSRRFSLRFAVFDALDESNDERRKEILDLFVNLQNFGYKLIISGRPPLTECYLRLSNVGALEIRTTEKDIEAYIFEKLEHQKVHKKVQAGCLELVKGADGM